MGKLGNVTFPEDDSFPLHEIYKMGKLEWGSWGNEDDSFPLHVSVLIGSRLAQLAGLPRNLI